MIQRRYKTGPQILHIRDEPLTVNQAQGHNHIPIIECVSPENSVSNVKFRPLFGSLNLTHFCMRCRSVTSRNRIKLNKRQVVIEPAHT